MQRQHVRVRDEAHGVALALVERLAVAGDLDEEPAARLEVLGHEVVEDDHVVLLGELHVVGDVLQDLGHEHQAALDVGRGLSEEERREAGEKELILIRDE